MKPQPSRFAAVRRHALLLALVAGGVAVAAAAWPRHGIDPALVVTVRRGDLTAQVTVSGTLRPAAALTYRSPLAGREAEIVELAREGLRVKEGDLLIRFDRTDMQADVERLQRELRQAQADLQVADGQRQEAESSVTTAADGEVVLAIEEARARLQLAEKRVLRLREEHAQLRPLLAKGFITREELARTSDQLEHAEAELELARKRTDVVSRVTQPRERQRAALQLAQKRSQFENAAVRVQELQARLEQSRRLLGDCTVSAQRPGLVVYEELLNVSPRRKVRVGDRVISTQGVITIPEVDRMLVEGTVGESEVHRVRAGQSAVVRLEAFPSLRLDARVVTVGSLAGAAADRPPEDKRFDLVVELLAATPELRPGMTARTDIVTSRRRGVLLLPVTAVFENQGVYTAHVIGRSRVAPRRIELGESNGEFVEVQSGLEDGERVALIKSEGRPVLQPRWYREYFRIAVEALGRYKLRTSLSVLGIVLGVAAVIATMSVSEGAAREALAQVQALGLDNLVVRSHAPSQGRGAWTGITTGDADRAAALVPGVRASSPLIDRYLRVSHTDRTATTRVLGVAPAFAAILRLSIDRGRFLSPSDVRAAARVTVLGSALARQLFLYRDPVGEHVRIGADYYKVVGVVREQGADPRSGSTLAWHDVDHAAFVPLTALSGRTLAVVPEQPADEIWLQVDDGARSALLAPVLERVLARRSGRAEFTVVVPQELLAQRRRTQRTFAVVVGSVAALALLVGGIGIMNIMLTSVVERTREIGVRRSAGATRRKVAAQFLIEALIMTVCGGVAGIVLGAGAAAAITAVAGWSTRVSPAGVALGFIVSFVVGVVFGLYPAMKAAALEPAEALRYE